LAELKMKKLIEKDKKNRKIIKTFEKKVFILKTIRNNPSLSFIIKLNALHNIHCLTKKASKTLISNRCVVTVNKKKFAKWTHYSRILFLRLAKTKKIYGLIKASW